jgi:hypothetical protein
MKPVVRVTQQGFTHCPSCSQFIKITESASQTVCPFCEAPLRESVKAKPSEFGSKLKLFGRGALLAGARFGALAFTDAETVRKVQELGAVDYLVKPLDIGHIVPAVNAVFDRILARSETADLQPAAPLAPMERAQTLSLLSAMAVGVLMHRFSLTRQAAVDRLHRMAASAGRSLDDEAEGLLDAVERLAAPGTH